MFALDLDENILHQVKSDSFIMENFRNMMMDQIGRDRIKYIEIATEAISSPSSQAQLLDKLYKDCKKIETIDFGKIADSKGNVTKYAYYDIIEDMIEIFESLGGGDSLENLTIIKKLQTILLNNAPDFMYGFRVNNDAIMNTYNLMVLTLHEMTSVCIIDATEFMRAKVKKGLSPAKLSKKNLMIVSIAKGFIREFETGQWSTIMKFYKSQGKDIKVNTKPEPKPANEVFTELIALPIGAIVILALVSLFFIIRLAVFYFYKTAGKVNGYIKENVEILKANVSVDNGVNMSEIEKQQFLLRKMENVSDMIEYRIYKIDKEAKAEVAKSNRENFSPKELQSNDFEFDF